VGQLVHAPHGGLQPVRSGSLGTEGGALEGEGLAGGSELCFKRRDSLAHLALPKVSRRPKGGDSEQHDGKSRDPKHLAQAATAATARVDPPGFRTLRHDFERGIVRGFLGVGHRGLRVGCP
jgi:hypothetical protein